MTTVEIARSPNLLKILGSPWPRMISYKRLITLQEGFTEPNGTARAMISTIAKYVIARSDKNIAAEVDRRLLGCEVC